MWTDERTYMAKLTAVYGNFTNASENAARCVVWLHVAILQESNLSVS
jgi:hypothetical protein